MKSWSTSYRRCFFLFCLLLPTTFSILLYPLQHVSGQQLIEEYQVKAVFLYNLTHFVNWPNETGESRAPFTIGIYGPDPFGSIIDQAVSKEKKHNQPIKIKRILTIDDLTQDCQILYVSSKAMADWDKIHKKIVGRPILSVSDNADFTRTGGMVSLMRQDQKINVVINHRQVRQSGLLMSAKLLGLARIVE